MAKRNPALKQEPEVDVLTIAYIAIGARTALGSVDDNALDSTGGGELEYIATCIQHARMVDTIGVGEEHQDYVGVHCYEIAEPFGELYGAAYLRGEGPDAKAIAEGILAELAVTYGRTA
jgi:hypothetical protein